jgi:Clr5 domain
MIRSNEWMKYQSTLKQLWMLENKSLRDVRKIMAEQHGFNASYAVPFITKYFCNLDRPHPLFVQLGTY